MVKEELRTMGERFQSVRMLVSAMLAAFTGHEEHWIGRWAVRLLLAAQFLVGLIVWGLILNWGNVPFQMADWYDVSSPRLRFLQQAVQKEELPLFTSSMDWAKGSTDRFLAIPDQILSPQILLLKWITPGQFSLFQVWLMYTLGYWGLLRLRRQWKLSIVAFLPLAWLFSFNGHIVDHIAIGHLTWAGYFLLPFIVQWAIELWTSQESFQPVAWGIRFGLLQAVIFFQGTFHLFVLNLILLVILLVFIPGKWKALMTAVLVSLLVSMVRILPAATVASQLDITFSSGFTSVGELLSGLVTLTPVSHALDALTPVNPQVAWWEYDFYIGWIGLAWCLAFGILLWFQKNISNHHFPRLMAVLGVLSILSVGRIYNVVFVLHLPMLTGERVTSRFFVLPLLFVAVFAAIGTQRWLDLHPKPISTQLWVFLGLFILLVNDLRQHYELWKVSELGSLFMPFKNPIPMELVQRSDPVYVLALTIGSIVSVISLIGFTGALVLIGRHAKLKKDSGPGTFSRS